MINVPFDQVQTGQYFKSLLAGAVFVKKDHWCGVPIKIDHRDFDNYEEYDFDKTTEVGLLEEHEWPVFNYKREIETWAWDKLVPTNSFRYDKYSDDHPYYCTWLGSTLSLMPSGKIYALWTSNQTEHDVNRDRQFSEALEKVTESKGLIASWEDGDLFLLKATTFAEVAQKNGYTVEESRLGKFHYRAPGDDENLSQPYDDEDDAWKACVEEEDLI